MCKSTYVWLYSNIFSRVKWVNINGITLKNGGVVVVSPYTEASESPEFAVIAEIFVLPTKQVLLGVKMLEVIDYNSHYHSWMVKNTDVNRVVNFYDLCSHQILHARSSNIS